MALTMESCGITTAHQAAIAGIAREKKTFIFVRPVNPDATGLIESGFKTKALDIHAKSSDWGPMAGFICADSSLSKVAGDPVKEQRNNLAVLQSLAHPNVGSVPLDLPRNRIEYLRAKHVPGINTTGDPFVATGARGTRKSFKLVSQPTFDTYRVQVEDAFGNFQDVIVIGYPSNTGHAIIPVTADYDIFAICPHYSSSDFSINKVTIVSENANMGVLSAYQMIVRQQINLRCGGHPVVNHGTELNNPFPEHDPELIMFTPAGGKKIVQRARLSAIFGDLTLHGFHVYFNAQWPVGVKETIQSKINQMKQPSRLGAQIPAVLGREDFDGLGLHGYGRDPKNDVFPSTAGSAVRFSADILNNRASAPGLPAARRPHWRP